MPSKQRTAKAKTKVAAPTPKSAVKDAPGTSDPLSALKAKKTITKPPPVPKSAAAQELESLAIKRNKLLEELKGIDIQIFNLETTYLDVANPQGNALIGYEGLVTQAHTTQQKPKPKSELRLFSGSSVSGAALHALNE